MDSYDLILIIIKQGRPRVGKLPLLETEEIGDNVVMRQSCMKWLSSSKIVNKIGKKAILH